MKSALFYQLLAGLLAVLLAVGGGFAVVMIHNAELEVEHFRKQEAEAKKQLDAVKVQLDKDQAILQRLETDPDFVDHLARQSPNNYAKPDELIFRFDVDQLTGAQPPGNLDTAHPTLNTPATTSLKMPPAATGTRHN